MHKLVRGRIASIWKMKLNTGKKMDISFLAYKVELNSREGGEKTKHRRRAMLLRLLKNRIRRYISSVGIRAWP